PDTLQPARSRRRRRKVPHEARSPVKPFTFGPAPVPFPGARLAFPEGAGVFRPLKTHLNQRGFSLGPSLCPAEARRGRHQCKQALILRPCDGVAPPKIFQSFGKSLLLDGAIGVTGI